jgi:peroxiredoxin
MSITIGTEAPDFTLRNTSKENISLSDYKGKNVLLLFFPFAFTGNCTEELCSTRDNMNMYESLNAEVLAISVDSPFTLGKFKSEYDYNFNLLSDFNKTVSPVYGAFYDEFVLDLRGVCKRSAFVIDKAGTVRYAEVLESAGDMPNFEAIKETLESLA